MEMNRIRERSFIPTEYLQMYMKMADKETRGIIFPHTYINKWGQKCNNLSPSNTGHIKPKKSHPQ